jgi:hypothetical protein
MADALDLSSNLRTLQTSFSAGELDPLMRMRTDVKAYFKGGRKARNVALYAQGGLRRRPGTVYKADLGASSVLHEYSYTDGQDYVLAFQNTKLLTYDSSGSALTAITGEAWTAAESKELTLAISGDTIIIFHKDHWPRQVTRDSATTFSIADFAFEEHSSGAPRYQPYFKFVADSVTMTPAATTGSGIAVSFSANVLDANHVGVIFRYGGKEVTIASVTDAQNGTIDIRETLGGTSASADWDEAAFSTVRGHPRCGTFHDQRLYMAGSTSRPDGFWSSKTSAFFNFDVGTAQDDEAIDASVAGGGEIRHLVATRNLQLFTNDGELFVPQSTSSPITPTNIRFIPQTPYGSGQKVNPVKFDGATLFLQKTGKVIREYVWVDTEQAYTSNAVSFLSNHLINSGVDSAVLLGTATSPEQYAFFVNENTGAATDTDGTVAVFHSVRNEDLAGWVQWNTDGDFESITSAGTSLFAATKRTINGSTVYWLEQFDWDVTVDAAAQVDYSTELTTNGAFTTDASWTKGTGWTIDGSDSNTADCDGTQVSSSDLEQAVSTPSGYIYRVKFTLSNVTAGSITPRVADGAGTAETADGTYIQYITASTGSNIQFRADSDFVGSIDDVSCVRVAKTFQAAHLPSTVTYATTNTASQYVGSYTSDGSGNITTDEYVSNIDIGLNYTLEVETMPVDAVLGKRGAVTGEKKRISRVVASIIGTQSLSLSGNELILTQSNQDFSIAPTAAEGDYQFFMLGWSLDPTVVINQTTPLPLGLRGLYLEVSA